MKFKVGDRLVSELLGEAKVLDANEHLYVYVLEDSSGKRTIVEDDIVEHYYKSHLKHILDTAIEEQVLTGTLNNDGQFNKKPMPTNIPAKKWTSAATITGEHIREAINNAYTTVYDDDYFNRIAYDVFGYLDTTQKDTGWTTYNDTGIKDLYPGTGISPTLQLCQHTFATYTGLATKYEYCTKCDTKKNERGAYED